MSKSQVAFGRRSGFAHLWRPGLSVKSDVPVVLSVALPRRIGSNRFKEVAHPDATTRMHHLELRDLAQLDDEVRSWLAEAHTAAE